LMKVMTKNQATGFMEDYTYHLQEGQEYILQAHMLEVDPTFALTKPKVLVQPLGIGGKEDPARLVDDGKAGQGIGASMLDLGSHYRLIINKMTAETPEVPAPLLPVERVIWKTEPNFIDRVTNWLESGGGHDTVASLAMAVDELKDWAKMVNLETIVID